jgi:hypothetical protein
MPSFATSTSLTEHGATYEWKEEYPNTLGKASLYQIHFPEGTEKHSGLMLQTARRFSIHFPDGFTLDGIDQYGRGAEDKTMLFLPTED